MGGRSRDRGGGGSAGGPVAELSLPRFAILTAVYTCGGVGTQLLLSLKQCNFLLSCPQYQRHLSLSQKNNGESSCSCCRPIKAGRRLFEHPVRGEWREDHTGMCSTSGVGIRHL